MSRSSTLLSLLYFFVQSFSHHRIARSTFQFCPRQRGVHFCAGHTAEKTGKLSLSGRFQLLIPRVGVAGMKGFATSNTSDKHGCRRKQPQVHCRASSGLVGILRSASGFKPPALRTWLRGVNCEDENSTCRLTSQGAGPAVQISDRPQQGQLDVYLP